METITINIDDLKVGSKLLSIKTQQVFTVVSTDNPSKVDIVSQQGDEKSLSHSTLKRWYKHIVSQEEPEQVLHPQYVECGRCGECRGALVCLRSGSHVP